MSNTILLKRSSVSGKVPLTTDLSLGELAINTYDGKAYIKMNNGADAIVELTKANLGNVTGTLAVGNGGTGATTLTGYVKGNGTSAMTASSTVPGSDVSGNIAGNAANVTGTVALANGGTGQTTANAALNALLPSQTGNNTKVLSTDGTNTSWTTVSSGGSGTVTSVSVASANGLAGTVATSTSTPAITLSTTVSGIVKGDGTSLSAAVAADFPTLNQNTTGTAANVTGTVALANGGTGATTQADAANAVLPSQSTNSGKFLTTDGTNVSWATAGGGGGSTPAFNVLGPLILEDDFIGTPAYYSDSSSQSYTYGTWGVIGKSNGPSLSIMTGEAGHPGIFRFGSGGMSSGTYAGFITTNAAAFTLGDIDTFRMVVRMNSGLSSNMGNTMRWGLFYFLTYANDNTGREASFWVNGSTLQARTRYGSTVTNEAVGSITLGNWYDLKIVRNNSNQSIAFYSNGSLLTTHTTSYGSIPPDSTAMMAGVVVMEPNGYTNQIDCDYFGLSTKTFSQRYT